MPAINLIPAPRLDARRRRSRRNRCVLGCMAYAVAAMAAAVAAHGVWGDADAHVTDRLAEAAADVDQTGKAIAAVRADLDAAHATLRASRSIAEQPDWSAVMALLAAKAGPDVALRACNVRPRDPDPQRTGGLTPDPKEAKKPGARPANARPEPPPEPVMALTVAGLGKTQYAVSQFALRLEATGLFARVSLIETNREAFERGEAIAFRVECSMEAPSKDAAAAMGRAPTAKLSAPQAAPPTPAGPATRPAGIARPTTVPASLRATAPAAPPRRGVPIGGGNG